MNDNDLTVEDLKELVEIYKGVYQKEGEFVNEVSGCSVDTYPKQFPT